MSCNQNESILHGHKPDISNSPNLTTHIPYFTITSHEVLSELQKIF